MTHEWTTTYERNAEGKVAVMRHIFTNGVMLEADLNAKIMRRYHMYVFIDEFSMNPDVYKYMQLLENTAAETNKY